MERVKLKTKIILSSDLEQYKDEKIKELYQDPYFLEFLKQYDLPKEMVRDSLGIFLDYVDDQHYCEKCPGIEKCAKKVPCMVAIPVIEETGIERKMQMCPKMLARRSIEKKFLAYDFDVNWLEKNLYNKADIDIAENRSVIIATLMSLIEKKSNRWIYLYGDSRLGKSYLVATFLVTYLQKNPKEKGAFLDSSTRFKELLDLSFADKVQFQQVLNSYIDVDVLVLDDFGSGYMSDYIRDSIVYPIINQRLKEKKLTIFISRIPLKKLETYLSGKSASGRIQAGQIVDIIRAMIKKEIPLEGISVY